MENMSDLRKENYSLWGNLNSFLETKIAFISNKYEEVIKRKNLKSGVC